MKIVGNTVVLSRRNLLALLAKLEENVLKPNSSACLLIKHCPLVGESGINGASMLVVKAEEDEIHYGEVTPGPMKPLTELGIQHLTHKIKKGKLDLASNSWKD